MQPLDTGWIRYLASSLFIGMVIGTTSASLPEGGKHIEFLICVSAHEEDDTFSVPSATLDTLMPFFAGLRIRKNRANFRDIPSISTRALLFCAWPREEVKKAAKVWGREWIFHTSCTKTEKSTLSEVRVLLSITCNDKNHVTTATTLNLCYGKSNTFFLCVDYSNGARK